MPSFSTKAGLRQVRGLRLLSCLLGLLCVVAMLAAQQANAAGVTTQSAAALPLPTGVTPASENSTVNGTACSTTDFCVAVGDVSTHSLELGYVASVTDGQPGTGTTVALPANAATTGQNASLLGVACQSGNVCTAYGAYNDNAHHTQMMVVEITGGVPATAAEVTAPADANAGQEYPQAISCPTTGPCVIAGYYGSSTTGRDVPLIVNVENGVPSPAVSSVSPANHNTSVPDAELADVACQSSGVCTAVGYYEGASGPLGLVVEVNGGTPAAGVEAVPGDAYSGGQNAGLDHVACPISGACEAVGTYNNSIGAAVNFSVPISDGTPGTAVGFAAPAGYFPTTPAVSLTGISCSSASMCVADGFYTDSGSSTQAALIIITPSGDSAQETVLPADAFTGSQNAEFFQYDTVSCVPSGMCVAAGYYKLGTSSYDSMLQEVSASGQVSSAVETPKPADSNSTSPDLKLLAGVACDLSGSCVATGFYDNTAGFDVPYEVTLQAPVSVATSSLPGASQGVPYSTTLAAGGAWGLYTWSLSSGSLPAGLSLNAQSGVISGTPTGSGSSAVTVQVTGTGSPLPTATQALTLSVTGAAAAGKGASATPVVTLLSSSGKISAGKLGVKLACSGAACSGTVKLESSKVVTVKHGKKRVRRHELVVIGTASYSVAAGGSATLAVQLNGAGKTALARAKGHRLAVTVLASVVGGSGVSRRETIYTSGKRKKR